MQQIDPMLAFELAFGNPPADKYEPELSSVIPFEFDAADSAGVSALRQQFD